MRALAFLVVLVVAAALTEAGQQAPARRPPGGATPPVNRPAPRREAQVPFKVGEALTYDVAWSSFLVAGSATTRVTEKRASFSSTAYSVVAEGRPVPLIARLYPLFYKMDSLVDSYSLLSQWSALYTEEGSRKRLASTRFDREARKAHYEISNEPTSKAAIAIAPAAQDGLTLLYTLRTRALKAGDRFSVPVVDDGSLYTVELSTTGPERVKVPLGDLEAWNVGVRIVDADERPVGSNIRIWVTTDARRLPAKIQADLPIGNFVLALREAR